MAARAPKAKGKNKVTASFEDTDAGWADREQVLASLKSVSVEVGYFADHGPHAKKGAPRNGEGPGMSIFERAVANQFGVPSTTEGGGGEIPPRPFMTVGFDSALASIEAGIVDALEPVKDARTATRGMRDAAEVMSSTMSRLIDDWSDPPNAEYTIKRKGDDNPLVESGAMRDSPIARYEAVEGGAPRQIVLKEPARPVARKGRRARGFKRPNFRSVFAALNAQAARNLAFRAPKKSQSKLSTATRFTARTRFRPRGSAKRPGQRTQ